MVASLNLLLPMRKLIRITPLAIILLAGILAVTFSSSLAVTDELSMVSPTACPTDGCAAGQRLNFNVSFSVNPQWTGINTQVCVYATKDGTSSWADVSDGWISDKGLLSDTTYTVGNYNSTCSSFVETDEEYLIGAYAKISDTSDQLEFALRINADTAQNGQIRVKVIETDSGGTFNILTFNEVLDIEVAQKTSLVYVGQTAVECGNHSPCYINSGDDGVNGLGTGLRDAILAVNAGSTIEILNDYPTKSNTVLVDKNLTLSGSDVDAVITYTGGETCTNNPMLLFTGGGTLKDLTVDDGSCVNTSRDLIHIDSPKNVIIKHNTLTDGNRAIVILDNSGQVNVEFNQINDNLSYAILRQTGSSSGDVNIIANNIINNRGWSQVNCNDSGTADHNFWGEGVDATSSTLNCGVSDGKQLGAPILLSSGGVGVEAIRKQVTGAVTYAFNNKIGVKRTDGSNYEVYIVNHGQGSDENIPFYEEGAGAIDACSNFYDVFLADGAVAADLTLTLKYDLNTSCVTAIESSDYCAQSDSSQYPLWWYDPLNYVTNGWEQTGGNTSCNMSDDTISVKVDNTSSPGLTSDLNFTPFVVGLQQPDGVTLSQFSAAFDVTYTDLKWITNSEINIKGFHILRSNSENGTYLRISPLIDAIGDTFIGGIYTYKDSDITFSQTYYYKLEIIGENGSTVQIFGPVSILTSTNTPTPTLTYTVTQTRTSTPTRTPYTTRTSTPYSYRSPTSYYRQNTSTPAGTPTPVRTYGPSSTPTRTLSSTSGTTTATSEYDSGYPVETQVSWSTSAYPAPDDEIIQNTPTPTPEDGSEDQETGGDQSGDSNEGDSTDDHGRKSRPWGYILLGAGGGLALLILISLILVKTRFS